MKKETAGIAIGSALALLSVVGVMASNITAAMFYGTVQISNNGSTATNQRVTFTLNTTDLIASGLVNSSLNNTAMKNDGGADTAYMPGLTPNPWAVFVNSIPGPNAKLNYTLYTGGNHTMNSSLAYFPGAAGMNTTDNASLELGNIFTINQTAWFDTSAGIGKTTIYKPNAIQSYVSGNGNITTNISWVVANSTLLLPTGVGSVTNWPHVFGAATHWQAVNTNDGATSYIFIANGENIVVDDTYQTANLSTSLNSSNCVINSVAVGAWGLTDLGPDIILKPTLKTHGLFYHGNTLAGSASGDNLGNTTFTTNPNTGLAWTVQEVNDMEIGIQGDTFSVGGFANITYVYSYVSYSPIPSLTMTGVSSGVHTVSVKSDTTNWSVLLDGATQQTTPSFGESVNNSANDWQFCSANTTPYLSRQTITINGTLQQDISWQYASTFTDASGNGHTAVPTFLTSTPSANLTANLTSFTPVTQSISTANATALVAQNITTAFISPPHMFTELSIAAPGADFINSILDGQNIPRALFWFPFLFGITNLFGLLAAWLTRSILIEAAFIGIILVVLSLMGGFGFWVCIEYIIGASAIVVFSKQFGF